MVQFTIFAKHLKESLASGGRFHVFLEPTVGKCNYNSIDYKLRNFD